MKTNSLEPKPRVLYPITGEILERGEETFWNEMHKLQEEERERIKRGEKIYEYGEWVCLEEACPREEDLYLTCSYDETGFCTYEESCDCYYFATDGDDYSDEWMHGRQNCFVGTRCGETMIIPDVYYWMPLPEVPWLREESEWSKTDERYPNADGYYITYSFDCYENMVDHIEKRMKIQKFSLEFGDSSNENRRHRKNVFYRWDPNGDTFDDEVKYWAPLPLPPPIWDFSGSNRDHAVRSWYRNHDKIWRQTNKEAKTE